ncbi:MAG TPA: hypothetical protein VNH11_09025 [Pirellulales bacterium]|nr:hypothetical protein [Pirellulales bacterium]
MNMPSEIRLLDHWHGIEVSAALVELTRTLAANRIDAQWWQLEGVSKSKRAQEGDHHWVWRKLVGEHRNSLVWDFIGAQTDDGDIQGAISYRIDARSFLSPEFGTVYVDRLAAAPRNRPWLVPSPRFAGVGKGLLLRTVCHSYWLGLNGRVNLMSLPSERTRAFYENRGFIATRERDDGMIEYELPAESAQAWLTQEGLL